MRSLSQIIRSNEERVKQQLDELAKKVDTTDRIVDAVSKTPLPPATEAEMVS